MTETRMLGPGDESVLDRVAPGVFDRPVSTPLITEFLNDGQHHLAVSIERGLVVGMATAVHYVHPDKPPQLWINEIGVAPTHRGHGIAKSLLAALLDLGKTLGCTEAWTLTDRTNTPAMNLYASKSGHRSPNDPVMFIFPLNAPD